jgi:hypothetical protein
MTVTEAFDIFKSELELPDSKQEEASKAQQELRAKISNYLYVPESLLTGSYPRHTKINPLDDIDILLVRTAERFGLATNGSGVFPQTAIDEVADAVRRSYPSTATLKKQARSVNVQLTGLTFGFDVIPAWLRTPDGYWIPDTETGTWLPTNPIKHAELMTVANERSQKRLKPVIKMAKHWNRHNYELLRSFHIELICRNIFSTQSIRDFPTGVATFLVFLKDCAGKKMMDPIYGESRIDKPLSNEDYTKLSAVIDGDAARAIQALKFQDDGLHDAAIALWKKIFLHGFPK